MNINSNNNDDYENNDNDHNNNSSKEIRSIKIVSNRWINDSGFRNQEES